MALCGNGLNLTLVRIKFVTSSHVRIYLCESNLALCFLFVIENLYQVFIIWLSYTFIL